MRLRMSDWAPLLDTSDVNHALLLPILLHCRDDQGRPLRSLPFVRLPSESIGNFSPAGSVGASASICRGSPEPRSAALS